MHQSAWAARPSSVLGTPGIGESVFPKGSWIFPEDSRKQLQNLIPEPKRERGNTSQRFTITHQFHYFMLYF